MVDHSAALFGVDVGGTFTDVVAVRDGTVVISKIPTNPSEAYAPVLEGAKQLGVTDAVAFNHASTHGLNAIITRRLPKIGFITTEGHRDVLDTGTVMRTWDHVTNPAWRRSFGDAMRPLVPRYLRRGVRERVAPDGSVALALNEEDMRHQLQVFRRCGVDGVAVCLINAFVNSEHEERIRELIIEEFGNDFVVSVSSGVSPIAKEYQRASTTVIDVIMKLTYTSYTEELRSGLGDLGFTGDLNYGDSSGTLIAADFAMEQPYRVVFSGPAGGTSASAHLGSEVGLSNLLCADVGGTSCDISVVSNGRPYKNVSFDLEPDLTVNSLATDIASIGAGGGSVVWVNNVGEVRVGPDSAGARPGPACYRLGGTRPTMTDVALLIGILDPHSFGGGALELSVDAAEDAIRSLNVELDFSERIRAAWTMGLNNIVEGIFNVALRHGVDPRSYTLMAFGAAGPMMLPPLLEHAHVKQVVVPPFPGHFSAVGLLSGNPVYADSRTLYTALVPDSATQIDELLNALTTRLEARVPADAETISVTRSFDARLFGQSASTPFIEIPDGPVTAETIPLLVERFHEEYELRYGNAFRSMPIEAVTFRVQIVVHSEKLRFPELAGRNGRRLAHQRTVTLSHLYDQPLQVPEYRREDLCADDIIHGPAIVREPASTTLVGPDQNMTVGRLGELIITSASSLSR